MPTFNAKFLPNDDVAFRCKENGTRYILSRAGGEYAVYREGKLIRTGARFACVDAIESDAKWTQFN